MEALQQNKIAIGPRRLCHANLTVANLERSVEFYNRVCGLEINGIERAHGITAGFLSNGNTHHDVGLVQRDGRKSGLDHFGWEMENELELVEAYHRITGAGLRIQRLTDQGTSRSIYLTDPDGASHQFYADFLKDWRQVYTGGDVVLHGRPSWTPGDPKPTTDPRYDADAKIVRVDKALAHPLRITRAIMRTADVKRALGFYADVAGLAPFYAAPQQRLVLLRGSAAKYDIALVFSDSAAGLERICFEMESDAEVDHAESNFGKAGIAIVGSYSTRRKRSVIISDPDGVHVEFAHDRNLEFQAGKTLTAAEAIAIA